MRRAHLAVGTAGLAAGLALAGTALAGPAGAESGGGCTTLLTSGGQYLRTCIGTSGPAIVASASVSGTNAAGMRICVTINNLPQNCATVTGTTGTVTKTIPAAPGSYTARGTYQTSTAVITSLSPTLTI
ncbi:hypothetical protein [Actinomadura rupiterrae]|uniref:hypothetical protein n=1 Tax=Actinomadura rupiterrae TaxID=559627 RepID=UPI0020A36FAE|nr:hypothetical protein [Actinomadura rupiterrae]MCP2336863.1 hypothetical protein [Actinomadura rupiterrae]